MDELSQKEARKYEKMWAVKGYRERSPGERVLPEFLYQVGNNRGTLIDFGLGCGRPALRLQKSGFEVTGVDITPSCMDPDVAEQVRFLQASLWELPPDLWADYGYCTDVMEHIPPEKVDDTLQCIQTACNKACFFQIATFKDGFGRKIGDTLHLTVKPAEWWRDKLRKIWPKVDTLALGRNAQFWCEK